MNKLYIFIIFLDDEQKNKKQISTRSRLFHVPSLFLCSLPQLLTATYSRTSGVAGGRGCTALCICTKSKQKSGEEKEKKTNKKTEGKEGEKRDITRHC